MAPLLTSPDAYSGSLLNCPDTATCLGSLLAALDLSYPPLTPVDLLFSQISLATLNYLSQLPATVTAACLRSLLPALAVVSLVQLPIISDSLPLVPTPCPLHLASATCPVSSTQPGWAVTCTSVLPPVSQDLLQLKAKVRAALTPLLGVSKVTCPQLLSSGPKVPSGGHLVSQSHHLIPPLAFSIHHPSSQVWGWGCVPRAEPGSWRLQWKQHT